jgi:F-type H+-transporting ATPase subunit delta
MAEIITVVRPAAAARPYARAAFEDAQSSHKLAIWADLLQAAARIAVDPAMRQLLGPWNPKMQREQKAILVAGLCRDVCGEALPEVFDAFLKVLAEFNRLDMLPGISVLFNRLRAEAENVLHAELVSASSITESQRKRVTKALKTKFKRSIVLNCRIDPALIAGATIRIGDRVVDGSVRGRLDKLAMILSQ